MVNVIVRLDGYVKGCARNSVDAAQAAQQTGVSDDQFWATQEPYLIKATTSGEYPKMAALSENVFQEVARTAFDFGLLRLLDGIETLVEARASAS